MSSEPQRPHGKLLPRIAAWVLISVGIFFFIIGLMPDDAKRPNPQGKLIVLLLGIVMLAGGILWRVMRRKDELKESHRFEEKAIVALAAKHGGKATLALIELETPLDADEAEAAMERLCKKHLAQPDLMEDGTVVYRFGSLVPELD